MTIRPSWSDWDPWGKLWEEWVRLRKGEKNIAMEHIQFIDLYNFFRRTVDALGIDPRIVDVEAFIDPGLTYEENKKILAEILQKPPTEAEYEAMYESYKNELLGQVEEKYPDVVAEFRKEIEKLEKETERLPKVERERAKFKKLSEDLRYELDETIRRHEEEKGALERKVAAVKLRILKSFREGIIDYTVGSVVETRDIDWALGLIEKGLAERVAVEVPVEVKPLAPPTAVPEEIFRPPPPKKPPEVPVKVLPPVPEKCPFDGTELIQMEMVPMLIMDPLRLTSEEEYWRARIGLPLPTVTAEMIEVPPTMKVWMCRQDHYFERDAAGRLVQRASDFLYRKILRETARLRRLLYPPPLPFGLPPEAVFKPEKLKPPFASPKRWLLETKGLTWGEFLALSDEERKILLHEYERLVRETK